VVSQYLGCSPSGICNSREVCLSKVEVWTGRVPDDSYSVASSIV
jgi:hypothetical protein